MADHNQFMICIPDEAMRCKLTKFKGFKFQTTDIEANVLPRNMSYEATCHLHVVWLEVHKNVPPFAKLEDSIMDMAYLVGDPIEVDLTSLEICGPVE
jgi:hypothetical protein